MKKVKAIALLEGRKDREMGTLIISSENKLL